MPPQLDDLLVELERLQADRMLNHLLGDVNRRLDEAAAVKAQTWRLRAAAVALVAMGGAAVSASTAANAAPQPASPFAVWSNLSPLMLLESDR